MKLRPSAVVDLLIAIPEHSGGPYPFTSFGPRSAVVAWEHGVRTICVRVEGGRTLIDHRDRSPDVGFRGTLEVGRHGDLISMVRDGIDWLRGDDLDRPPIPFPDDEREV